MLFPWHQFVSLICVRVLLFSGILLHTQLVDLWSTLVPLAFCRVDLVIVLTNTQACESCVTQLVHDCVFDTLTSTYSIFFLFILCRRSSDVWKASLAWTCKLDLLDVCWEQHVMYWVKRVVSCTIKFTLSLKQSVIIFVSQNVYSLWKPSTGKYWGFLFKSGCFDMAKTRIVTSIIQLQSL